MVPDHALALLRTDPTFATFGVRLPDGPWNEPVQDATFYLRRDGLLVNAEGWHHPPGRLIGEVIYAPSAGGQKCFFGQPYEKTTLYRGTYEPIPYAIRPSLLAQYDSSLDQTAVNPYFTRYKQVFHRTEFCAAFPPLHSLAAALESSLTSTARLKQDLANLETLLAGTLDNVPLGLTGAMSLGAISHYHDLDIVFYGSLEENRAIAERMRALTQHEPARRCFEGSKAWSPRFHNDYGMLMCCFFGYKNASDIPLADFSFDAQRPDAIVEGTVCDDRHSMYTPSVLTLTDVRVCPSAAWRPSSTECLELVVYHTASRGDCYRGDRVKARGALGALSTQAHATTHALFVIERDGLVNLTPPWPGYYGSVW